MTLEHAKEYHSVSQWNKTKTNVQKYPTFHIKHCTAMIIILALYLETSSSDLDHQGCHFGHFMAQIKKFQDYIYQWHPQTFHLSFHTAYAQKLKKCEEQKSNHQYISYQNPLYNLIYLHATIHITSTQQIMPFYWHNKSIIEIFNITKLLSTNTSHNHIEELPGKLYACPMNSCERDVQWVPDQRNTCWTHDLQQPEPPPL